MLSHSQNITTRTIGAGYEGAGYLSVTDITYRERTSFVFVDGTEVLRIRGDRFAIVIDEPYTAANGMPGYRRLLDHGMPSDLSHEQACQWWADELALHQEAA